MRRQTREARPTQRTGEPAAPMRSRAPSRTFQSRRGADRRSMSRRRGSRAGAGRRVRSSRRRGGSRPGSSRRLRDRRGGGRRGLRRWRGSAGRPATDPPDERPEAGKDDRDEESQYPTRHAQLVGFIRGAFMDASLASGLPCRGARGRLTLRPSLRPLCIAFAPLETPVGPTRRPGRVRGGVTIRSSDGPI